MFFVSGELHQLRIFDKSRHPIVDIDYGVHAEFGKQETLHILFGRDQLAIETMLDCLQEKI